MSRLIVITGTKREAACFEDHTVGSGDKVLCSGARATRLSSIVEQELQNDYCALVSFGLAGGLVNDLAPGMLVIPSKISDRTGAIRRVNSNARNILIETLVDNNIAWVDRLVCGVNKPLTTPAEKEALHLLNNADVVDMESHIAGEIAEKAGMPWLVIRAIADHSSNTIPRVATNSVMENGAISAKNLLIGSLGRPSEIPALISLARNSLNGLSVLRRVVPLFLGCHPF